jgi:drug/metabolite transporter (DMT)-like permease
MDTRLKAILFAVATAVFWGLYGPSVAKARTTVKPPEGWSSFKPFLFIGLAYLVWGCIVGAAAMRQFGDTFSFSGSHSAAAKWGFIGGSMGAFGALTLTFALFVSKGNFGLVMPIVFGGAVTVTALVNVVQGKASHSPLLWVGMLLVLCGIVLVAMYSHESHGPAPASGGGASSTQSATGGAEH